MSLCTPDTSWPSLACQQSMETIADTIRHHPEFWYTHTGPHHHFHTHSHPPLHSTVLHTHSVFVHSRHVLTIASMSAIDGNHRRHHPTSPWILVHPHRPKFVESYIIRLVNPCHTPISSPKAANLASIETLKSHWCIWWVLLENLQVGAITMDFTVHPTPKCATDTGEPLSHTDLVTQGC